MPRVALTQGYFAEVDEADLPLVEGRTWRVLKQPHKKTVYATTVIKDDAGKPHTVLMHRLIMGVTDRRQVDHRDGNGLNNHRLNLRVATGSQNVMNQSVRRTSSTGVKGVQLLPSGRYRAVIQFEGARKHLGVFDTIELAKRRYETEEQILAGHFASSLSRGGSDAGRLLSQ
jgi:hypothetical protein